MLALYRRCLEKGAFPALRPTFGEAIEIFYQVANDAQLEDVSPISLFEANTFDVSLHVLAESNTRNMTGIDPAKMSKVRKARQELSRLRKERVDGISQAFRPMPMHRTPVYRFGTLRNSFFQPVF